MRKLILNLAYRHACSYCFVLFQATFSQIFTIYVRLICPIELLAIYNNIAKLFKVSSVVMMAT